MDDEERLRGLSEFVVYLLADVSVHHLRYAKSDYGAVPELVDLLKDQKYIKIRSNGLIEITKKGRNLYGGLLDKIREGVDFSTLFNK